MRRTRDAIDPIARLTEEHGVIVSVMDAFERCAECFRIGSAELSDLMRFTYFFREYGELNHHQKEESIAFAALSAHGFQEGKGPRADLHDQHLREQSSLSHISHRVLSEASLEEVDREHLVALIAGFCAIQREHMLSESEHFYPALRKLLTPTESQIMAQKLEEFDKEKNLEGAVDWLLELAEQLELKFSAPASVA